METTQQPASDATTPHARVASRTRGRVRIKLHHVKGKPDEMQKLRDHVAAQPGVERVESNPTTGSLLVHYAPTAMGLDEVLDIFRDVGVLFHDVSEGPEEEPSGPGHSRASGHVISAVDRLDQDLSRLTGRRIDLKLLFPLGLGLIGIRQLITSGAGLAEVPAYVLLWYAFDSFWKFHREPAHRREPADPEDEEHIQVAGENVDVGPRPDPANASASGG